MKNARIYKALAVGLSITSFLISQVIDWAVDREQNIIIEEKVQKALEEKETLHENRSL